MTICIAAACKDGTEPKIVVCTDSKTSSVLGSAEIAHKCVWLTEGWACLTAGIESDILALVRLYNILFKDENNRKAENIDSTIKNALYQRRQDLSDEYIKHRFSISHDEFIIFGKEKLPPEVFFDATQKVSQIELNADLIITGFIDKAPEIYYTDSRGNCRAASHFAVVGEGEYIASSALLRRKQNDWISLEDTLYNVFEAKKLSESIGSVGHSTYMAVIPDDGSASLTSLELDRQLNEWFIKYGPQPLPYKPKFEGNYYNNRKPNDGG